MRETPPPHQRTDTTTDRRIQVAFAWTMRSCSESNHHQAQNSLRGKHFPSSTRRRHQSILKRGCDDLGKQLRLRFRFSVPSDQVTQKTSYKIGTADLLRHWCGRAKLHPRVCQRKGSHEETLAGVRRNDPRVFGIRGVVFAQRNSRISIVWFPTAGANRLYWLQHAARDLGENPGGRVSIYDRAEHVCVF
jgi:hypothetical protein